MAGNYEYPTDSGETTIKPEGWGVGLFDRRYIVTYCKFGFRRRSTISEPWMQLNFDRVFSLKTWGKDGYR